MASHGSFDRLQRSEFRFSYVPFEKPVRSIYTSLPKRWEAPTPVLIGLCLWGFSSVWPYGALVRYPHVA